MKETSYGQGNLKFKFNAFLWCSNLNLVAFHFSNEFELNHWTLFNPGKKIESNLKIAKCHQIKNGE